MTEFESPPSQSEIEVKSKDALLAKERPPQTPEEPGIETSLGSAETRATTQVTTNKFLRPETGNNHLSQALSPDIHSYQNLLNETTQTKVARKKSWPLKAANSIRSANDFLTANTPRAIASFSALGTATAVSILSPDIPALSGALIVAGGLMLGDATRPVTKLVDAINGRRNWKRFQATPQLSPEALSKLLVRYDEPLSSNTITDVLRLEGRRSVSNDERYNLIQEAFKKNQQSKPDNIKPEDWERMIRQDTVRKVVEAQRLAQLERRSPRKMVVDALIQAGDLGIGVLGLIGAVKGITSALGPRIPASILGVVDDVVGPITTLFSSISEKIRV